MGKGLLRLPRRLFGYQASSVDQLISDRDSMLGAAEQRVRSAEARIAELQEELSRRDEDLAAVKARLVPGEDPAPAETSRVFGMEPDVDREADVAEPPAAAPSWISEPPARPAPVALGPDEMEDDAEEVDEWPIPPIRPRTVEFTPPPEPSADFDPMPIGGEEHGWVSPATDRWGTGGEEQSAQAETPWKAPAQEPGDWYVSPADETANAEAHPEPAEDEVEHHEGPSFQDVLPQLTPAFMSEELANVVKAAEESATRIIERAWESTQMQIAQVDRLWREVQEEIIRFAAWRQHVDPMISTVQSYIEEARARIEQVPTRIQEALSPAVEAIARVDEGMSEFAKASDLPQLLGKLHAEVAKAVDTGDSSATSSESRATEQEFEPPTEMPDVDVQVGHETPEAPQAEGHAARELHEIGGDHEAHANGNAPAHYAEDTDLARAIAHEIHIINEPGEPISSQDTG